MAFFALVPATDAGTTQGYRGWLEVTLLARIDSYARCEGTNRWRVAGKAGHHLRQKQIPSRLLRNFPWGGPTTERPTRRGLRKNDHGQHRRLIGSLNARYGRDADIYRPYACQDRALCRGTP